MKLRSIAKEAADCRAAWDAMPDARYGVHIHHETVAEILTQPIEHRISYILDHKPKDEQALRLRLMRPITAQARKAYREAVAQAEKAYDEAVAPAWKAYNEAVAPARKAYREAVAQAQKAYNEAVAPARKAYHEAVAPAWKAYDEAEAPAWKAYREAEAQAHTAVCPTADCPWTDGSIFGGRDER